MTLSIPYRFYSTYIFAEKDEVSCDAISIDGQKFVVGQNVLHDVASLQKLARHWRAKLELDDRRLEEYDERFQPFIHVGTQKIPVDHLCAEINGIRVRVDFTASAKYIKVSNRWRWTSTRSKYKALRLFASALRQAALQKA